MSKRNISWVALSLLVVFSMLVAGCAQATVAPTTEAPPAATQPPAAPTQPPAAPPTMAPTQPPAAPTTAPTMAPAAPGALTFKTPVIPGGPLDQALQGKFKGTTVTFDGPFSSGDQVKFEASVKDFEAATGIKIQYVGGKEFESHIRVAVEGGSPPDMADFPQPGLLASFAKEGKVLDLSSFLPMDYLKGQYKQGWLDMGQMQGPNGPFTAGIWARYNGKSQVWYPKAEFDAAGYKVPTTWDEMMALTDQIASDGDTAWCIGIESGAATGWPMTDWIEDVMLRTTTPENYDKWVAGTLKFDSPEVNNAVDIVTKIWFNDKYVYGGRNSIATCNFGTCAPQPMFEKPPKCWLHRQGNFITSFFPEGLKAGTDYDFFYLPPIDTQYGSPYLIAGDIYGIFNDRPEVRAVLEYFTHAESLKSWMAAGGALSPHNDQELSWYGDPMEKKIADLVLKANTVRFDGSDQMPAAVGQGTFWKEMTAFVSGQIDKATALKEIDASWPK